MHSFVLLAALALYLLLWLLTPLALAVAVAACCGHWRRRFRLLARPSLFVFRLFSRAHLQSTAAAATVLMAALHACSRPFVQAYAAAATRGIFASLI